MTAALLHENLLAETHREEIVALHPDLIILLPGILGSSLAKDGKPLWGTSVGSLASVVFGGALDVLELSGPDDLSDDIGDGVEVTGIVPNVEVVPGFWKHGGYSIISRSLRVGIDVEVGRNFFEFAYDWRRDNRVSARKLNAVARSKLADWRKSSGNAEAQIVLVAHSMGGLVSRYFIECLDGWRITRRLISIGTPYRGSLDAVGTICNGAAKKVGPITLADASKASRSFQSLYQLLPVYPVIDAGEGLVRVDALHLPNLDRTRAAAALKFHQEMTDANANNRKNEEYVNRGELVAPTVGIEQATFQSARLANGKVELLRVHEGTDYFGDGTVPRISATPIGFSGTSSHVANTHSALPNDQGAMYQFRGLITADAINFEKFRSSNLVANIGIELDDAYVAGQQFGIEARVSDYRQTLRASVKRLDAEAEPVEITLRPSENVYRGNLTLDPGVYGLAVSASDARTTEDVFVVAPD